MPRPRFAPTLVGMDVRIISLGTLAAHPLWGEREPVRTGHATTTLIRAADKAILVDPGLPAQVIAARLAERANLTPANVTHVFLTSFHPDVRRGIRAFDAATWWISEAEREAVGVPLTAALRDAHDKGDTDLLRTLEDEVAILRACRPAPDQIATEKGERVDLFPLHGVTPGLSGLLIAAHRGTTLICGDAIPTIEHLEQGRILPTAHDLDAAREAFAEAVEIADTLILGRDNAVENPSRRI